MKNLFIAPVVALMMMGFVPQLLTIAENTQDKTIAFADDMNNALDCATRGIPIELCSPKLTSYNFETEIEDFTQVNQEIIDILEEYKPQNTEVTIKQEGNVTIITIK